MNGGCLCGGVVYAAEPPLREGIVCHCTQSRETSGCVWTATSVPRDRCRLVSSARRVWDQTSGHARRGLCWVRSASLFREPCDESRISLGAGTLDGLTGLRIDSHWHIGNAGDTDPIPPDTQDAR